MTGQRQSSSGLVAFEKENPRRYVFSLDEHSTCNAACAGSSAVEAGPLRLVVFLKVGESRFPTHLPLAFHFPPFCKRRELRWPCGTPVGKPFCRLSTPRGPPASQHCRRQEELFSSPLLADQVSGEAQRCERSSRGRRIPRRCLEGS